MRPWLYLRNSAGVLALGASLALASPGVKVVRAEPEKPVARPAPARPAQCATPAPTAARAYDTEAFLSRIRSEYASRSSQNASRPAGGVVALNNSGYNYVPAPRVQRPPARHGSDPR